MSKDWDNSTIAMPELLSLLILTYRSGLGYLQKPNPPKYNTTQFICLNKIQKYSYRVPLFLFLGWSISSFAFAEQHCGHWRRSNESFLSFEKVTTFFHSSSISLKDYDKVSTTPCLAKLINLSLNTHHMITSICYFLI